MLKKLEKLMKLRTISKYLGISSQYDKPQVKVSDVDCVLDPVMISRETFSRLNFSRVF